MVSCDTYIASSEGYFLLSQPEICSGDQSALSFSATKSRRRSFTESRHLLGRRALCQAFSSALVARYLVRPPLRFHFPTDSGSGSGQPGGDSTQRFSGSEPAGDLLPLDQSECAPSPAPLGRRDPSGGLEHPVDGAGRLL